MYHSEADIENALRTVDSHAALQGAYDEPAAVAWPKKTDVDANDVRLAQLLLDRDLQRMLVANGYRLRLYVPYGDAWYPYLMRRLAERPANVLFLARNLFRK